MIPELGHIALIISLMLALVQSVVPLVGAQTRTSSWISLARPVARAQFTFMLISYIALTYAFLTHDFTVEYVANNSNTQLPVIYLISGVWGAHEGSLLLWALTLSLWTLMVTYFSKSVPEVMVARVISVLGLVTVGFLLFMLLTSNPFDRIVPAPPEGRDLNPLLQDIGLAIHPPMLYMGYVGFAVPFAFAIAAMLGGQLDAAWARWSRPWTNVAWLFLTLGIALGSWWAYYELGWGGWWFWDPVENASFMPWLVGTALMHSLAVTEKRAAFKAWTVLLAIFAFSLSLLGTFLVRSGVLTSVHAFASDPERGVFILLFLVAVVGGSLSLYAWRAREIRSRVQFEVFSRETALLMNNVILVVAAASVLLGTLYPLALDALQLGKISVGPPYFNAVFIPLTAPLVVLMGAGIMVRWKKDSLKNLLPRLWIPLIASFVGGLTFVLALMPEFHLQAALGMILAIWVVLGIIVDVRGRLANGRRFWSLPMGYFGMMLGHIGIAVFVVGITLVSIYSTEKDVRMQKGDSVNLGGYDFTFQGVREFRGKNYVASEGIVTVSRDGEEVVRMLPQKRVYLVQKNPMTEAAIDAGLTRDLFVALGEKLDTKGAWSLRLYHKPYIRWIWLGAIIMSLGALLSAADPRYRKLARREVEANAEAAGARA
ncbi:MAG: heme lyase CcmF/NrfE family subunit [Gammaproteobacteria bacterium]|nr:heme lyase CcmF/NrfE family subunit [Gammaproteobacteria bacterium]